MLRGGGSGSWVKSVFPVPVELVERRILGLKRRLAGLAARSRDPEVVEAVSGLLVSLTELLEGLGEGGDPVLVLGLLRVLEEEAEALLRRPELAHEA